MATNENSTLVEDVLEAKQKYRQLKGWQRYWSRALLTILGFSGLLFAMRVHTALGIELFNRQFLGLFFGIALAVVFFIVPATKASPKDRIPWYDYISHCLVLTIGVYTFYRAPTLPFTIYNTADSIFGAIAIILAMEAVRRSVGRILFSVAVIFLLYMVFGYLIPGELGGLKLSIQDISAYLYFDNNATLGITLYVAATILIAFFLLAEVLMSLKCQDFLVDFASGSMGRSRGGPAKVCVIAASLFGMITGSAVANVVFTGSMTIPLMKKMGYPRHVAAAISAAASTGSNFLPPMMGITAFIMASFLGVRYVAICIAAALPAIIYYFSLFIQVDLEAAKQQIRGLSPGEYPPLRKTMKRAYLFVIPLGALIYFLFIQQLEPDLAAGYTVLTGIAMGLIVNWKNIAMLKEIPGIFEMGAKKLLDIIVISLVAGIVMGVVARSGLAVTIGLIVAELGTTIGLFGMLLIVALICIFLGMGMPTALIYIFLSMLVGGAMVEAGLPRLASHLFIFYFGLVSLLTPPVAFAAFTAASIAGAKFFETGWRATRMGIAAYIVPFLFLFQPALLMQGSVAHIIPVFLLASVAVVCAAVLMTRHSLYAPINWYESLVLLATTVGLIYVVIYGNPALWWITLLISGIVLFAILSKGKLYRRSAYQTGGA